MIVRDDEVPLMLAHGSLTISGMWGLTADILVGSMQIGERPPACTRKVRPSGRRVLIFPLTHFPVVRAMPLLSCRCSLRIPFPGLVEGSEFVEVSSAALRIGYVPYKAGTEHDKHSDAP